VVITGTNGFIATHIAFTLLKAGYKVHGTVRNVNDPKNNFLKNVDNLKLFSIPDISQYNGFDEAFANVDYVVNAASPLLLGEVTDPENQLIKPAVNGVKNAFNAALKAGAKKFIQLSSVAAIYGDQRKKNPQHVFTSKDWNELPDTHPYVKSKVEQEKLLWKLAEEHPEMTVISILPSVTLGSLYDSNSVSTLGFIQSIISGEYLKNPKPMDDLMGLNGFGFVNVRDVSDAVLKAIENPFANGKRFLLASVKDTTFAEMSNILREMYPEFKMAYNDRVIPLQEVGTEISDTTALLGRRLTSLKDTLQESIDTLTKHNLIKRN